MGDTHALKKKKSVTQIYLVLAPPFLPSNIKAFPQTSLLTVADETSVPIQAKPWPSF